MTDGLCDNIRMNSPIAIIRSAVAQSDNLTDLDAVIAESPDLFIGRTPKVVREAVEPGRVVRLMAGGAAETFHVEVLDRTASGVFFGRIDNDLMATEMHGLRCDDIVVFEARHIREVKPEEGVKDPSIWNKPLVMMVPAGRSIDDPSTDPIESFEPRYVDEMGGDYMTVADFRENVECGGFIDYDGYCYAVTRGDVACTTEVFYPSQIARLPSETTHVIWFNR